MSETTSVDTDGEKKVRVIPKGVLMPFILVTCLFSLWGFANDITNPMVAAFKNILLISNSRVRSSNSRSTGAIA